MFAPSSDLKISRVAVSSWYQISPLRFRKSGWRELITTVVAPLSMTDWLRMLGSGRCSWDGGRGLFADIRARLRGIFGSCCRQTSKHFLTLRELENLAQEAADLLRRLERRSGRWRQLILGQSPGDRREQNVHSLLDCHPLLSVPSKIALVHREWNGRQVDLSDQARHARHLDRIGVAEEFAARDEAAELVAAQSRHVVDATAFGLSDSVPTPKRGASGVNGEPVLFLERDRRHFYTRAVDGDLQLRAQDERPIGLAESDVQPARVETLVNAFYPNPNVAHLC